MKNIRVNRRLYAAIPFFLLMTAVCSASLRADTRAVPNLETRMDWSSGIFSLQASMALEPGMSPEDHPRALEAMERELPALVAEELSMLAWDNMGTLGDMIRRQPAARTVIELMAQSLQRQWSRLSSNYSRVEALYILNLGEALSLYFPSPVPFALEETPPGWTPLPADGWTGVNIYLPAELHLRGTMREEQSQAALRARILGSDLQVLFEPSSASSRLLTYLPLSRRAEGEEITGRRPYRTMARELYGDFPCDLVLSDEDTRNLLSSPSGREALAEGRVLILLEE